MPANAEGTVNGAQSVPTTTCAVSLTVLDETKRCQNGEGEEVMHAPVRNSDRENSRKWRQSSGSNARPTRKQVTFFFPAG